MTVRPLLLGEAPAANGDPDRPLSGLPSRRICRCLGVPFDDGAEAYRQVLARFRVRNTIRSREDAYPWSAPAARRHAEEWLPDYLRGGAPVIVCLGRRAAGAIGHHGPWYEWRESDGELRYASVLVPHPSGLNRAWNDPKTTARFRAALEQAIDRAGALVG